MFFLTSSSAALLACLFATSATATPVSPNSYSLPIVDLGYVKQQASSYNATGRYYYFNNIAFAQPPIGNLRWAPPVRPTYIRGVQNGRFESPQCPQAYPAWLQGSTPDVPEPPAAPSENEDCLYLDVIVPEKIFQQKQRAAAPVFTWIYGGGNVVGSKQQFGPGNGIVERSMQNTSSDGVIFVAMNYRLGAFGYLGGPVYKAQGGTQNLALLDQKLALEWIQENIHKFGGDAHRVTAVGESGGAGAIGHHLTAPQNKDHPPFRQAVFQSPGVPPTLAQEDFLDTQFAEFLKGVNASNLAEARTLDTKTLQNWNRQYNYNGPKGIFTWFPAFDGNYVVSTVPQGLNAGRFDHSVKIITAHNSNEGAIFSPNPTEFDFRGLAHFWASTASNATLDHISNDLYPASAYSSEAVRAQALVGDLLFNCNHYALQRAFNNQGPSYLFAVPPGNHVQDVPYTFYGNGIPVNIGYGLADPKVSTDLQTYLVNFAVYGNPNAGHKLPVMPKYGKTGNMLQLTTKQDTVVVDPNHTQRCEFWATYK